LKEGLLKSLGSFQEARGDALERKLYTLLSSAASYLQLTLKSAEARETDREQLRAKALGSGQAYADLQFQFKLIAERAAGRIRTTIERHFQKHVRFQLDPRDLSLVTEKGQHEVQPGSYRVFVGGSQPAEGAAGVEAIVSITGEHRLSR